MNGWRKRQFSGGYSVLAAGYTCISTHTGIPAQSRFNRDLPTSWTIDISEALEAQYLNYGSYWSLIHCISECLRVLELLMTAERRGQQAAVLCTG